MKILHIGEVGLEHAAQEAAQVLSDGGIVLYPTDTLYGLAVDIHNAQALEKLYALKQRSVNRTALLAVPSRDTIGFYGQMNEVALSLADRFLPGPLTLVLAATLSVPQGIIRDDQTVGIRMPNDPFCLALNGAFAAPYTSTSANVSDMPTLPTIDAILQQFGSAAKEITLCIDDGPRAGGVPSTIVSCVDAMPRIIREGAVSKEILGIV